MRTLVIVLAAVAAALFVFVTVSGRTFYRAFVQRSLEIRQAAGRQPEAPVTAADLAGLPAPVTRYLAFSGAVGKKRISAARLKHSGSFRPGVRQPFRPIAGEYFLTTNKPSFTWYGSVRIFPGFSADAFDSYFDGQGRTRVRLLGAFPVVDAGSQETSRSAFGRCIAEMTLVPSFFLDGGRIRWRQTGEDSARCTVTDAGFAAEAEFFVNPDGSLRQVVVMRPFDRGGGKTSLEKFTAAFSGWREHGGYTLPAVLDGYWNLEEGDLHYVHFVIDAVELE